MNCKRDWVGIEKSGQYIEMAEKRIAEYHDQTTV
jgi:DNA modification methylase